MDVREAVETRLEVREYSDEPVPEETTRAILDAGRLASSGKNLEHWRFILVDDADALDRLGDLSPTGSWIADAAFAVVVCTDPSYAFHKIDAGRAVTHMQLVAWEDGVGSCIYTVDQPAVNDALEIPDEYALTAVVGFGYPTQDITGIKQRQPLEDIAYHGTFGTPLNGT